MVDERRENTSLTGVYINSVEDSPPLLCVTPVQPSLWTTVTVGVTMSPWSSLGLPRTGGDEARGETQDGDIPDPKLLVVSSLLRDSLGATSVYIRSLVSGRTHVSTEGVAP